VRHVCLDAKGISFEEGRGNRMTAYGQFQSSPQTGSFWPGCGLTTQACNYGTSSPALEGAVMLRADYHNATPTGSLISADQPRLNGLRNCLRSRSHPKLVLD
jgi:hypothetical protein